MKTTIRYILLATLVAFAGTGCKKKVDDVSQVVKVTYPTIVLTGDSVVSTSLGTGVYTDPGATGTDDITGASSTLTPVVNNVDLTQPGFYSVKYTTKNSNGFQTSKVRLVLVTAVDPALDYSGTYARTSNGQEVHVTKVGTGLYTTDNVGGVPDNPAFVFPVFFGQTSDTTIQVPLQSTPLGDLYAVNGGLYVAPDDTAFNYAIRNGNFGTQQRTFSHQ